MHTLLFSLVAIAALDSLNPTAIALQIYLLSIPKPIGRSVSFIVGVFSAYWISGLLVILGLRKLIMTVIANADLSLSEPHLYTIQFLIGLILLIAGFRLKNSNSAGRGKHPKKLTLDRTFLLGMAMTPKILRILMLGLGFLLIFDSLAYRFAHSFLKLSQLS